MTSLMSVYRRSVASRLSQLTIGKEMPSVAPLARAMNRWNGDGVGYRMGYRTSPRRWRPGPFGRRSCTRWRRTPDQAGSGGLNLAVQQRGTQASGAHRCAQFRQVARHLPRSQARATQSADPKAATVPDSRPPQASRAARSGKSSSQRLQFVFPAAAAARHAPQALPCPRGGRVSTPPGPGSADCRAGARSPGPARRRPGRAAAGTPGQRGGLIPGRDQRQAGIQAANSLPSAAMATRRSAIWAQ